jgi:hypothetical protein
MNAREVDFEWLKGLALDATLVGSRVTCNPPPMDTDQDVLILVSIEGFGDFVQKLYETGFSLDGSEVTNQQEYIEKDETFQSFSIGEWNAICTCDVTFYKRFVAATEVARRLNLLDKSDRIALFQAVLYGNGCESKNEIF